VTQERYTGALENSGESIWGMEGSRQGWERSHEMKKLSTCACKEESEECAHADERKWHTKAKIRKGTTLQGGQLGSWLILIHLSSNLKIFQRKQNHHGLFKRQQFLNLKISEFFIYKKFCLMLKGHEWFVGREQVMKETVVNNLNFTLYITRANQFWIGGWGGKLVKSRLTRNPMEMFR
jgi:hypothetical protein